MRKSLVLLFVLLLASASLSQDQKQESKTLRNSDIVLMTQNHFDDETLVKAIEASETDFDISSDALIELKNQGVSPPVLRAMLEATKKKHAAPTANDKPAPADTAASPATETAKTPENPAPSAMVAGFGGMPGSAGARGMNPQMLASMQSQLSAMGMGGLMGGMFSAPSYSAAQMPHVFLMGPPNQGKNEISPSTAQVGQTKMKGGVSPGGMMLRSMATEGLSFAAMGAGPAGMMAMSAFSMASGFMPGMRPGAPSMAYFWGLPGRKSSREMTNLTPMFELSYGDIPGVDPDRYEPAVVKLYPTRDNYRLVGATQTKMDAKHMMSGGGPDNGKWVSEERWPTRLDKEERGFYVLHVDKPFEPGEYAVVLRPAKHYKASASEFGGGAQVFYSVWDFSVPGVTEEEMGKKKKK